MTEQKTMPIRMRGDQEMSLAQRMWKDPVWSKVISTGIIAAIAGIATTGAHLAGITLAEAWAALGQVGRLLCATVDIPRWLFWLWIAFTLGLGALAFTTIRPRLVVTAEPEPVDTSKPKIPPQAAYQSDVLFGVKWRWKVNPANKVWDLNMYCPKCDHQLLDSDFEEYRYREYRWTCENCQHSKDMGETAPHDLTLKAMRAVERKLRTGEWKQDTKPTKSIQH